jgi:plastocyanin
VTIQDFTFSPASVTIKVGAAVQWTNHGPSTHTATSDTDVWDSGQLSPSNGQFQMTFTQAGTFPYHCTNHPPSRYPNFTGTVTVTQ